MDRDLMRCPDCGEFCVSSTSRSGDPYRVGSAACTNCGGTDLSEIAVEG